MIYLESPTGPIENVYTPGVGEVMRGSPSGFGIDGTGRAFFDPTGSVPASEAGHLLVENGAIVLLKGTG